MLAIVVVFIIVLSLLRVPTLWMEDEAPPDAETVEDGVIVIRGDVLWQQHTGFLDNPVEVRNGGNLRILESRLSIRLERLVLHNRGWFRVLGGGSLELEDTDIVVVAPDDLDDICFFEQGFWQGNLEAYIPPFIFRAVNLVGTVDPNLEFRLDTLGREGALVVAVQPSPGEPMEPVSIIEVSAENYTGWRHHRVSLADHRGSVVTVLLMTGSQALDGILVRDVRVEDPGHPLAGDQFPTGRPTEDGWYRSGVDKLTEWMEYNRWNDLFSVWGELDILGSSLVCPSLPRVSRRNDEGPFKHTLEFSGRPHSIAKLSEGGNVRVRGGEVAIEDSDLDNVTVVADHSTVAVRDSSIVADREPLTMFACAGSVTGTHLRSAYGPHSDYNPWWGPEEPQLWALSLWDEQGTEPFLISDCTFEDSVIGVDLAHANADLRDCVFANCSWLAVWDHDSRGIGDWDDIDASNEFTDCHGRWYFRTHDCTVEYSGPGLPTDPFEPHVSSVGSVHASDGGWLPSATILWTYRTVAWLYMPTLIVNRYGEPIRPEWIELDLETSWGGGVRERLPTDERDHVVVFPGANTTLPPDDDELDERLPFLHLTSEEPGSLGVIELMINIYRLEQTTGLPEPAQDLELEVHLDGEMTRVIDVDEEGVHHSYGSTEILLEQPLDPGFHEMSLVLTGMQYDETERSVIDVVNRTMARVNETTPMDLVEEWVKGSYNLLILDPGVVVELEGIDPPPSDYSYVHWSVSLLMYEGATFHLSDVDRGEDLEFGIGLTGAGSVILEDMNVLWSYIDARGGSLWMSNLTWQASEMAFVNSTVVFNGSSLGTSWLYMADSTLNLDHSQIILVESFWMDSSDLTVTNSSLSGGDEDFFTELGTGDLTIVDSQFHGVNLTIMVHDEVNGTLALSGCEFSGDPCVLEIILANESQEDLDRIAVSNNTFIGGGSGLQVPGILLEKVSASNDLVDGAAFDVWIETLLVIEPVHPDLRPWNYNVRLSMSSGSMTRYEMHPTDDGRRCRALVTLADASDLDYPMPADCTILYGDWEYGHVVWYAEVDLGFERSTLTVPYWGDQVEMVHRLLEDLANEPWWERET